MKLWIIFSIVAVFSVAPIHGRPRYENNYYREISVKQETTTENQSTSATVPTIPTSPTTDTTTISSSTTSSTEPTTPTIDTTTDTSTISSTESTSSPTDTTTTTTEPSIETTTPKGNANTVMLSFGLLLISILLNGVLF